MSAALRRLGLKPVFSPGLKSMVTSTTSASTSPARASSSKSSVVDSCDKSSCPLKCEGLSADRVLFACPHCNLLVDHPCRSDINRFDLMGVRRTFDLDPSGLKKRFKSLQTSLHPDKFATAGDATQKELAEEWSAIVNDAYNKLLKPLDRALYLLEIHGAPLAEGDIQIDPGFLAEIMEINEEVAEAESAADLSGISEANKVVLKKYIQKVSKAFAEGRIADAKSHVAKMKYYSNIQDKIVEKETAFGVV